MLTWRCAGRAAVIISLVAAGCGRDVPVTAEPGAPLPGLTAAQLERFHAGRELFTRVFTEEDGLGPVYQENSCNACHHDPETGGHSNEAGLRAVRYVEPDTCDPLRGEGGLVRLQVTPRFRALGGTGEEPPPHATHAAYFLPLPLFGAGLLEAIPDDTLIALSRRGEAAGVQTGRVSRLADGTIGRFRRKADRSSIAELVEAGFVHALGITTPQRPDELDYRGAPLPPGADLVADPEIDLESMALVTDFIRFLAPPARAQPVDEADARTIARGEALFHDVGCSTCHVPALRTGPSDVAALSRRVVPLYSDLLLHDMGSELASLCGPTATLTEHRTAPLWGLRYRSMYMHDGNAVDLWEAINRHGGAAARARDAFRQRDEVAQAAMIRFLSTL
jgi:CxxC motif-containing protein (DUF1111 family)